MKTEYKEAVDTGNVAMVRIALSNELLFDPRGDSFIEMLEYAIQHLPNLFEENKDASYSVPPKDQWNEDFMYEVKSDLDANFSKEKLAFYEAVVKYVGKDKAIEVEEEESVPVMDNTSTQREHPTRTIKITKVSGGITAGGAIVATVGLCTGMTALSVIGGAIFVGGVLLIIMIIKIIHGDYPRQKRRNSELDALLNGVPMPEETSTPVAVPAPSSVASVEKDERDSALQKRNQLEMESYSSRALQALSMVDDIVTKDYVMRLSEMDIVPVDKSEIGRDTILFKVNKMVYEKDEYATEKFINALGAMCYAECSVFLILDGHKDRTDFYIGIRNNDPKRTDSSVAETFENSMKGQFPGIDLEQCSVPEHVGSLSIQQQLFERFNNASSVTSCSGIPAYKDDDGKYTNQTFIQGIENLLLPCKARSILL